ncbi:MAG: hypothetical protein KJ041_05165, partial [Gammaproteobacteria bacterium]|nr:hypothetical protein [Gammaproteobacteria bacterium]
KIFWRGANRTIERFARIFQQPGTPTRKYFENMAKITMDEFQTICDACHAEGLPVYLYLSIFDEGWPPEAGWDRPMCWQSEFTIAHPEYLECDRAGKAVN